MRAVPLSGADLVLVLVEVLSFVAVERKPQKGSYLGRAGSSEITKKKPHCFPIFTAERLEQRHSIYLFLLLWLLQGNSRTCHGRRSV